MHLTIVNQAMRITLCARAGLLLGRLPARFDFHTRAPLLPAASQHRARSIYRLTNDNFATYATCGAASNSSPNDYSRYSPPARTYIPHSYFGRVRFARQICP